MPDWAITVVRSGQERAFRDRLCAQGDVAYYPLSRYTRKPRHKKKPVVAMRPTFTGYVFVALQGHAYDHALIAPMFLYAMRCNGDLVVLNNATIAELVERECAGDFDFLQNDLRLLLQPADRVLAVEGPFEGREGSVLRAPNRRGDTKVDFGGLSVELPIAFLKIPR